MRGDVTWAYSGMDTAMELMKRMDHAAWRRRWGEEDEEEEEAGEGNDTKGTRRNKRIMEKTKGHYKD